MRYQRLIMLSFGIIYFWFGMLKFFPGISPAEVLAGETIHILTFSSVSSNAGVKLLAIIESLIGLACIFGVLRNIIFKLILAHMFCTFAPFILLPEKVFGEYWFSLTLVGQYILKNVVFIAVLLGLYLMHPNEKREYKLDRKWNLYNSFQKLNSFKLFHSLHSKKSNSIGK